MMRILTIAAREYNAVVRSKAFVVSIILLPVMMIGSMVVARFSQQVRDETQRKIVVIDRTPGEQIFPKLEDALKKRTDLDSRFILERITPASADAVDRQRFELSERVRRGQIAGILEIGANVPTAVVKWNADQAPDTDVVRFRTNTPAAMGFRDWAERTVDFLVKRNRLTAINVPADQLDKLLWRVPVVSAGLAQKDASGAIVYTAADREIASFLIPFGLVFLMFIVVVIGAVPMLQGIIEEKQQRIAEILLASVSPFQLMAGKVLGIVATSFTLILVYLGGAYWAAHQANMTEYLPLHVIAWFIVFQFLSVLMYGSLYIAIGAACTDTKEMQSLLMPVNLLMAIPLMLMMPIILSPRGVLARTMSYFPPATPFVTVARLSVPPGISVGEMLVSIVIVVVTTVILIWASGRVFRVGILMQGKGANLAQLAKWVVRG
jgi:ABC-2 type transport system permease protein